jgi:hypothetical protein
VLGLPIAAVLELEMFGSLVNATMLPRLELRSISWLRQPHT